MAVGAERAEVTAEEIILMLDRDGEIRRNPIFWDFFLFEIGSGAYRAGPLGGEGVVRIFLAVVR
jgi:hypothetical protein